MERIPDQYKEDLIRSTGEIIEDFYDKMRKIEEEAVAVMKTQVWLLILQLR